MPNKSSNHHIPFNLFLYVILILCISFIMIVLDNTKLTVLLPSTTNQLTDMYADETNSYVPLKLSEVAYDGFTFNSYRLLNPFDSPVVSTIEPFGVGTSVDNIAVVSNYPGWANSAWLFDFVGDEMYVVNTQNNALDIFNMVTSEYSRSLSLPSYESGLLYGIDCESEVYCNVRTALSIESGCSLAFNPTTEEFSAPLCAQGLGTEINTFVPELKSTYEDLN